MEHSITIIIGKSVLTLTRHKLLIAMFVEFYALGLLSLVSCTIREAHQARKKRTSLYYLAKQISHYKDDKLFILKNRENGLFVGNHKPAKNDPYSNYY